MRTKNSGIKWIEEIPESWNIMRLKQVVSSLSSGGTPDSSNELFYSDTGILWVTISDMSSSTIIIDTQKKLTKAGLENKNLKIFQLGTLLYAMYASVGKVSELGAPAAINQAILAIEVDYRFAQKEFLKYCLQAYEQFVYAESNGNTQYNLNAYKVANFYFAFPKIYIQRQIADHLDKKCAAIDSMVANQQAQIEKLKEYKQSVITEAVTKGLDPSVPMKPSGVEWIGEVPINFSIQNIRSLFQIRKEVIGREPETVLSITQSGLKIKNVSENEGQMANSYANYQIVHIGDFAMNHMDLLTGGIGISKYEGVTSPDYRVFKIKKVSYIKKYFLYVFETYYRNKIFYAFGQGAANLGRWRLPAQNFYSIFIPVPSVKDQQQIADHLDKKCAEIDKLISVKQQKIEKLNEYKKSLIYEYVTGKKEVG